MDGSGFKIIGGAAGNSGNAVGSAGGLGGDGGSATFHSDGKVLVTSPLMLEIEKTKAKLHMWINQLEVTDGQYVDMNINTTGLGFGDSSATGNLTAGHTDSVGFGTMFLNRDAEFRTNGVVDPSRTGNGLNAYTVNNFDMITRASWYTNGIYKPDNVNAGNSDYMRFDMADIAPDGLMTKMDRNGSNGAADLSAFDAVAQHGRFTQLLIDRGILADDTEYDIARRDQTSGAAKPLLTSPYQTKRLNLGGVTLMERTTGTGMRDAQAGGGALGSHIYLGEDGNCHYRATGAGGAADTEGVHDGFAYTAGLRRYYWDVYEDSATPGTGRLMANNYFTADATRVLLQGALAEVVNADQTFITGTLQSIGNLVGRLKAGEDGFDGVIGYSGIKSDTGSWLDSKTFAAAITYGHKYATKNGNSTIGAFVEYGDGDYDVFSHIYRYGGVYGSGDSKSFGGGLFFAREFSPGIKLDMSVRAGRVDNTFTLTSDPWLNRPGVHSYDTDAAYYGGHIGVSRKIPLKNKADVTVYAQGRYTHIAEDSFVTAFGDPVYVGGTGSLRTRVGVRLSKDNLADTVKAFIGAAWEHEFDGDATGMFGADGIVNPPSLEGDSLFGELGIQIKAGENTNVDLSAYGYAGDREGYGVRLGVDHKF